MKQYKIVYHWNVLDELEYGTTIFAIDRANLVLTVVNEMVVADAMELIKTAIENPTCIEFWQEVKEETDNG